MDNNTEILKGEAQIMKEKERNIERMKEAVEKGTYSNSELSIYNKMLNGYTQILEDNLKTVQSYNTQIVKCAANLIFGKKIDRDVTEQERKDILRFFIEDICRISVADFYQLYNTKMLGDIHIRGLTTDIWEASSIETKVECMFNPKLVIFKECFPEYYEQIKEVYTPEMIYNCNGDIRNSLIRAGGFDPKVLKDQVDTELEQQEMLAKNPDMDIKRNKDGSIRKPKIKKAETSGKEVDKICFEAIKGFLEQNIGIYDFEEQMEYLAQLPLATKGTGQKMPNIYKIIQKRGCYDNMLDFYVLNSNPVTQQEYVQEYLEIRNKFGYPEIPLLTELAKLYIENEAEILMNC